MKKTQYLNKEGKEPCDNKLTKMQETMALCMKGKRRREKKQYVVIIGYACGIFSFHANNKDSLHFNKYGFLIRFKPY